jgi:SapC
MKITAPYGYDEIAPLRKDQRVLLPAGNTPAFCRGLSALAISLAEFSIAARDYPIVFATLDRGKSFAPVIVLGLEQGTNLFVDAAGEWDRAVYFPAFVRRYPFCISKLYVDGEPKSERVVCVAKAYVDPGGVELFDAQGAPTPAWQAAERLLVEFEADLDRTAQMCAALARLQLLEPFTVQALAGEQAAIKLAGMHRISEPKLRDLKAASHKVLVAKGFMGLIYAHLHSLENFSRLLARQRKTAGRS